MLIPILILISIPGQRKQSKELESQQNFYSKQMEISSSKNNSKQNFNSFKDMMNLSLLKDPIFIMFNVANFATSLGYYVIIIFLDIFSV